MFPASLLSTLLLALVVSANPIVQVRLGLVTLPIARSFNFTNVRSLYEHDLARAQNFKTRSGSDKVKRAVFSIPATNEVVGYYVTVCCGSPPTCCTLLHLSTPFLALTLFAPPVPKLDQLIVDTGRPAPFIFSQWYAHFSL